MTTEREVPASDSAPEHACTTTEYFRLDTPERLAFHQNIQKAADIFHDIQKVADILHETGSGDADGKGGAKLIQTCPYLTEVPERLVAEGQQTLTELRMLKVIREEARAATTMQKEAP